MMKGSKLFVFVLLFVTVPMLAACQQGVSGGQPAADSAALAADATTASTVTSNGGVTSEQAASKNLQLDPALAGDADSIKIDSYLYEGLVKIDSAGKPAPALSTQWTLSGDQLAYRFELAPGAVFSDGSPVTADAIIASFNRWFDTANPDHGSGDYQAWQDAFGGFKGETDGDGKPKSSFDGIQKVDNTTVLIQLNRPDPDLLTKLSKINFAIVVKSGDKFIGSGPYVIGELNDTHLLLVPNAQYWAGPPTDNLDFPLK